MGGEYYSRTVQAKTDEEAVAAFENIRESCLYESGHGGYTGTFAEKEEIKILPPPPCRRTPAQEREFWTREELDEFAQEQDKWGDAFGGKINETEYYLCGWCSA
jgi:hypothetical protein